MSSLTQELKSKLDVLQTDQIDAKVKLGDLSKDVTKMGETLKKDFEDKINHLHHHKIKGLHRKVTMNEEKLKENESITKDLNQKLSQRIDEIGKP